MINVVQHGEEYWITFPYDPKVVSLVKAVPHRKWDPDSKHWYIPKDDLGLLISQFRGTDYEDSVVIKSIESINVNEALDEPQPIPEFDLPGDEILPQLYPHQLDFMRYALHRQEVERNTNGFLVCDEMGLGKSLEAIQLALYNREHLGFKHCLVICCVNTSKYNWRDEVSEHTGGSEAGYILGTRRKRGGGFNYIGTSKGKLDDLESRHMFGDPDAPELPYFLIVNVEALRYEVKGKTVFANAVKLAIADGYISMVVIDEMHKNLAPKSKQGKAILAIKNATGKSCMWLPMTGTPIVNKPTDLYTPLRLVDAHDEGSYWNWVQRFCVKGGFGGHQIVGYKNMKLLKSILMPNMVRRLKDDVLDLPDKIETIEYVENSKAQKKLYAMVEEGIRDDNLEIIKSLNPLAKLTRLRQVNGSPEIVDESIKVDSKYPSVNAKLSKLLELVDSIHESGDKMVIFSNWVEPLRTIYRFLRPKYDVATFTGTMNTDRRMAEKDRFINDPGCRIILGTIDALGTTHTITVANHVIFYDEPWTESNRSQAIDRCHRIGATKTLVIHTLITKDTIDNTVHNIVHAKKGMSKFIVDNDLDLYNNPELLDKLLEHE